MGRNGENEIERERIRKIEAEGSTKMREKEAERKLGNSKEDC